MIIREIAKSEIGFLKEMLYDAIFVEEGQPKLPKFIIEEPSLAKYITNFGSNEYDLCLVAVENEELIGACWGRIFDEYNKGYGFLDTETPELSIAVKEQHRNKGIGTKLIYNIAEYYSGLNIKTLSLSVDKKNLAIGLYKKIGFTTMKETEKSVVMRLELSSDGI
ncbi:GNAT family N-acetyltransferase [Maribacter chungangensis]|uniref:GNAT family N-acetyltransferase n=1 Tax=Maribacter chungangensis TaxID=1069117 RepID=A0ABW3B628_9FLAO